jgi:hypothetical protein
MFDEAEHLADQLGRVIHPSAPSATHRLQTVTTRLGNEAGVSKRPNVLARVRSYGWSSARPRPALPSRRLHHG